MTSPGSVASRIRQGPAFARMRSFVIAVFAALCVFEGMRRGTAFGEKLIAAIIVVSLVVACARRPYVAVIGIVIWVPFQVVVLSYLFKLGAPLPAVRYLGYLKEFWAMSLGLALFVAPEAYRTHRRLDALDAVVMLYVTVATAYLLIPLAAPGTLGGQSFSVRLNAWREEALYAVVFLFVRQLRFPDKWLRRTRNAVLVSAAVFAGFAIWESVNRAGFSRFLANTVGLPEYRTQVLHISALNSPVLSAVTVAGATVARDGSLFNNAITFGFFMLIPLGFGLERLAARRLSLLGAIGAAAAFAGVVLSLVRSAALGAGLAAVLAVGFASRRAPGRMRLILAMSTAVIVLLPSAGHSQLKARFENIFGSHRDSESQDHVNAARTGLFYVLQFPEGKGLGTNTATGNRFSTGLQATAEDSYIETGIEIGLAAMVLLVTAVLLLLYQLRARSKLGGPYGELAGAMWLSGSGLAVGALFLEPWFDLATALVFWTCAGLALAGGDDPERPSGARRAALLDRTWSG